LSAIGAANTANWPPLGGGQSGGGISRGSDWFTTTVAYLNVSDRYQMIVNTNQNRDYRYGGRGVRNW